MIETAFLSLRPILILLPLAFPPSNQYSLIYISEIFSVFQK